MVKGKSAIVLFTVFVAVLGMDLNPAKIRGVQIKNKGKRNLLIEMTGETNFIIPAGQMASLIVEDTWSGKILSKSEECESKECNTPYTEARLLFGGNNDEDQYSVSVQNGFNIPIVVQPQNFYNYCKPAGCSTDLTPLCPQNHQIKNEEGKVTACTTVTNILPKDCLFVTSQEDEKSNTYSCKANTYIVTIG